MFCHFSFQKKLRSSYQTLVRAEFQAQAKRKIGFIQPQLEPCLYKNRAAQASGSIIQATVTI